MPEAFTLNVSHTLQHQPVVAGTIVQFNAEVRSIRAAQLDEKFEFDWVVTGPFSGDREVLRNHGSRFDFDTKGRRAGAYTIQAERRKRDNAADPGTNGATVVDDDEVLDNVDPLFGTSRAKGPRPGERETPASENLVSPAMKVLVTAADAVNTEGVVPVSLQRTAIAETPDQVLWILIRNRTNAIGFRNYRRFIDAVMCRGQDIRLNGTHQALNFTGTQAYEVLKQATYAFLMQEAGVIDEQALDVDRPNVTLAGDAPFTLTELAAHEEARRLGRQDGRPVTTDDLLRMRGLYYEQLKDENVVLLPYLRIIRDRLSDLPLKSATETPPNCYGILRSRVTGPLALELIWSYWHEEGMLAQSLNAVLARFQNRRLVDGLDPLSRFDLDPLRPLSNLFWGWAEDETHRLTVRRRSFEYDHEYGLTLLGKAIPRRKVADSRSSFIESFHTLLNQCNEFFKEDDDTTVIADAFPLLNSLRETHLVLSEGAHNQFGDLPSTARAEMLIMQWLLARPEMRDFLGGRVMVPYEEEWMDRVDSMKQMHGWTSTSITHFRDMGVFGEQLLLAIRYGNWSVVNDPQQAANWARYWRPEIQRYIHAYRAATGIDLNSQADRTPPPELLQRRLLARRA